MAGNQDLMHLMDPTLTQPSILSMPMNKPIDTTLGISSLASSWPWTETLSWNEMQMDQEWSSSVSLTSLDMFRDEVMGGDASNCPSPDRGPLSPRGPMLGLAQPESVDA